MFTSLRGSRIFCREHAPPQWSLPRVQTISTCPPARPLPLAKAGPRVGGHLARGNYCRAAREQAQTSAPSLPPTSVCLQVPSLVAPGTLSVDWGWHLTEVCSLWKQVQRGQSYSYPEHLTLVLFWFPLKPLVRRGKWISRGAGIES